MSSALPPADPSKRLVRWKRHLRGTPRARRRLVRAVGSGTLLLALGLAPFASLRLASTAQAAPLPLAVTARQAPALFARTSNFPATIDLGTLDGSDGTRLDGVAAGDYAGWVVSDAGDVNGDGFADLLTGAPYADPNGDYSGAVYVLFGGGGSFPATLELGTLDGSDGFVINGAAEAYYAGYAASGAGDVNGDGFDDLLIGADGADPNGYDSGVAYLVFGGATVGSGGVIELSDLDGSDGFALNGAVAYDKAGYAVSGAGDVNGDGFADLLIGAPYASPNAAYSGAAYVVFGAAGVGSSGTVELSALDGSDGFVMNGAAAADYAGYAVSEAGDVNGDGFDDLLVGAPFADLNGSNSGTAYVVFGGAGVGSSGAIELSALDGSDGFALNGVAVDDRTSYAVSGAGDVNGDGFADLLISAPRADPNGSNSGVAYVVFGGADVGSSGTIELSALDGSDGFVLNGGAVNDRAGRWVSGAGDVNGDGFADLLIGAPFADLNSAPDVGAAYVVFGGATVGSGGDMELSALDGNNGFVLTGAAVGDQAGYSVSAAGDINGDGTADLLVGATGSATNGSNAGAAYLLFGRADTVVVELGGLSGPDGFALDGAATDDRAGSAVSDAGDVNGDGFADLLVGAPRADPTGSQSGAAYVLFGGAGGFAGSVALSALDGSDGFVLEGAAAFDRAGNVVSGAGDVNGDGFDDLLIGADLADPNGDLSGAAYLVFGGAGVGSGGVVELGTLNGSTGFRLEGAAEYDRVGAAVSGAGDVNGDGFDDLLVGAYGADPNGDVSGSAYLVFGGAAVGSTGTIELSALNGSAGFRLNGAAEDDRAGNAVSGAGDVNGDGFADLLIGAHGADPNGSSSGSAYVVFGGAGVGSGGVVELGTLNGSDGFRLEGAAGESVGRAVSGAGDVNGDGFADLLIGAPDADPNGSNSGAAYLVFGGASGFSASVALGSLDGSDGFALPGVAGDRAGLAVSGAGDVNGDGFDDLLIGAQFADTNGYNAGAAYVVFGGAGVGSGGTVALGSLDSSSGLVLNGAAEYDYAGWAVSGAGDVNGDGFVDLIIGAPSAYNADAAYVVFGARLNHPILPGGPGADTLRSTSAPQQLFGAQGADTLFGGFGDDLLDGGAGDDLLTGDAGDDLLRGGSGSDTYGFADGWGNDRVEEDHVRGNPFTYQFADGWGDERVEEEPLSAPPTTGDTLDFAAVTEPLDVTLGSISVTDSNGNSVEYGGTEVEQVTGGSGEDTFTVTASSLQKNGDLTLDGGGAEEDTLIFDPQGQPFTQSGDPTNGTITLTNSGVTLTYQNMGVALAVDLASFEALATPDAILLRWETVSEVNALGFYLRRSTDGAQVGERLHPDLIPAQAPGSGQGASYEWLDESAEPGVPYFYWLEAVALSGESSLHGPVSALVELPTALTVSPLIMEATPVAPWGALGAALLGLLGALGLRRRR